MATHQALIDHPRELDATPVPPAAEIPLSPPKVSIAGTGVSVVNYETAVRYIESWAARRESRYVCVCPATGITTAWRDGRFRRVLNDADLVTPDGFPVAATLRLLGTPVRRRVYGPDLMLEVCRACARRGWPIFLFGATEETLAKLRDSLPARIPGLRIAGAHAPPFRPLTMDEDSKITERINSSGARVVFVGIGMPKQERWMSEHRGRVRAVMIGVGAAFDFHAGTVRQAPAWMQRRGLEWLFRVVAEPRRLWLRYTKTVPVFSAIALAQILRNGRGAPTHSEVGRLGPSCEPGQPDSR
ncbi:MAG: WecB/TagA/CpsF family glycosyltransferase [Planctomycetota bacterium]